MVAGSVLAVFLVLLSVAYLNRETIWSRVYNWVESECYLQTVNRAAAATNEDRDFLLAVIYVESRFEPRAVSEKGAVGLMQLLPTTAAEVAKENGMEFADTVSLEKSLRDPETNVMLGAIYLSDMRARFGDTRLALAAYNGGPTALAQWMSDNPSDSEVSKFPKGETRQYVSSVEKTYSRVKRLSRFVDWMQERI